MQAQANNPQLDLGVARRHYRAMLEGDSVGVRRPKSDFHSRAGGLRIPIAQVEAESIAARKGQRAPWHGTLCFRRQRLICKDAIL